MRTIVNATLSYGLMSVPVGIGAAAKRHDVEFRTLHEKCIAPISTLKKCSSCGQTPEDFEIVKGYEFSKGQFVIVEKDDLEKLAAERSKVIKVTKFMPGADLDELAVEKNFWLIPSEIPGLAKGYATLSEAMIETGTIALATSSLWGKEHPSMIWPSYTGSLVISMLFCHDEVVPDTDLVPRVEAAMPSDQELEMAKELIALSVRPFNPQEDLRSESRERIQDYLSAKVQGLDFDFAEPEEVLAPTIDFMAQLRASIEGEKRKVEA